jgi:hypothetical protein
MTELLHRIALRATVLLALVALTASTSVASSYASVPPRPAPQAAEPESWPQEIVLPQGTIVVYQPQPEGLEGNKLSGRAAFQLIIEGRDPIFGAFWYEARIEQGSDEDSLLIRSADVTRVSWPESTAENEERFSRLVEERVEAAGLEISRQRLAASLGASERELASLDLIRNDPPHIVFREQLAVLLMYDGDPRFSEIEGSDWERALNAPMAIARRKGTSAVYLASGKFWYRSDGPLGPFQPITTPPADLAAMLPAPEAEDLEGAPTSPPAIVVATEPTELIVTDGQPDWRALATGELLYVANTESPWLRLLSSGEMFILLSGRWFRSTSADGPWEFVRGDLLPQAFADIPPDSDIGGVRSAVAGTDEADEAVLDAQVPQVAAIKRNEATVTVEYDGDPKFEAIPGTSVSYALNTGSQVIEVGGRYYAVDDAVWFASDSPTGPWQVADSIPQEQISEIPPSAPVYNVTHVHVYDSTPDVVYVGYTPGYVWSYPYHGVPIYGTGWYYPPYWGPRYYYPRTPTWGFHVGWNPWSGWNFGVSWSNGFFSFGVRWGGGWYGGYRPWGCCGGWYGGGWRRPVVINTGNINIGNTINVGNRASIGNRVRGDAGVADRMGNVRRGNNLYNRPDNRARVADRSALNRDIQRARPATGRANDVFVDRNGNVARRAGDQWQTRNNGQWRDALQNRAQPQNRTGIQARPQLDRGGLNRDLSSRRTGARREMSARSRTGRARGGIRRR